MRLLFWLFNAVCAVTFSVSFVSSTLAQGEVKLPKPSFKGNVSVEEALLGVRSIRNFGSKPLTLGQVSQILWAANGNLPPDAVSGATTKVTPSAGGIYPLEVFLVSGQDSVSGLPAGIYRYRPQTNALATLTSGDQRAAVAQSAVGQMWLARAPAIVIIAAEFARMRPKYGDRGVQYVFIEAGNADQNVCLQAAALGLRVGTVGAFNDPQLTQAMKLPKGIDPILIIAVGS